VGELESFELALTRTLVQQEGYTWYPPGVLFPELSLFKSMGRRGALIRVVRGEETESLQDLLHSSFAEAKEILKDHPFDGITVVQLITYLSPPEEGQLRELKGLELHHIAPDIAVHSAWIDFESKSFASNLPWFSRGLLPKAAVLESAKLPQEPDRMQEYQQDIENALELRKAEWANVFVQDSSKAVYSIIGIIAGMFIWMYIAGRGSVPDVLIRFGAKENSLILAGEYWRFVTPVFLHLDTLHLIVNAFALYALRVAEWIYGSNRYLLVFLAAGVAGNVASFVLSAAPSAGASGAIFGVLGSLLYFGTQRRNFFRRTMGSAIWTTLAVNMALGFFIPQISISGHIGGLVGGFLAAAAVGLPGQNIPKHRIAGGLSLLALLAAGIAYGFLKYT
jgi:membrane associated rhomboid family serine protease